MNIIICEDTLEDSQLLRSFIHKYFQEQNCPVNINIYNNSDSFLKEWETLKEKDVKIAFLDIYMPGRNGIDIAKKIRETDEDIIVIFTTTSTEHALEGYRVDALQYLVKPLEYTEVENVLKKCFSLFADSLRYIEVMSDRLTVRIYIKDIIYVEVYGSVLYIYTRKETVKTFMPLAEMEKLLEGDSFLRPYRSYIVNMNYISKMTANDFILQNGKAIPIRRDDKMAIKQVYRDYLFALTRGM